jgi:hypothetical protein
MRKTFANTIRPGLQVQRNRRGVTVKHHDQFGTLEYRSQRANADSAAHLNSKCPVLVVNALPGHWMKP